MVFEVNHLAGIYRNDKLMVLYENHVVMEHERCSLAEMLLFAS